MRVFVSWSGSRGKALAERISVWLPQALQAVSPYFSPDDIGKGTRWSDELAKELEISQVGLLIVTRESMASSWLMFEAGALWQNPNRATVIPVLFGLAENELTGPLAQFQCAVFGRRDMRRVLRVINARLGDGALPTDSLDIAFDTWWPSLEREVTTSFRRAAPTPQGRRSDRDLLEQILQELRVTKSVAPAVAIASARAEPTQKADQLSVAEVLRRMKAGGNLSGANLQFLSLKGVNLSKANLRGANLAGANLTRVNLTGATLAGANLENATMDGSDLRDADLSSVNLWHVSAKKVRHLALVRDWTNANVYKITGLSEKDWAVLRTQNVILAPDYPTFFDHFRAQGLSRGDLEELFLWLFTPAYTKYQSLFE